MSNRDADRIAKRLRTNVRRRPSGRTENVSAVMLKEKTLSLMSNGDAKSINVPGQLVVTVCVQPPARPKNQAEC